MRNAVIWVVLCALAVLMVSNYLTGAIFLAFKPSGSDFSELYAGSWLWRQNQNPYDPALATSARQRTVGSSAEIFLINFPTSLVLVAPFTALPWAWANLFFLLLGLIGLAATIFSVLRLRGHPSWTIGTVSLAVFVLAFSPLRIAFQWGNIVVLVLPLSVLTIVFAEHKQDWLAGVLLALACCLKPQIGIWFGIYYVARGRFRIVFSSLGVAAVIATLFFLHPIPYHNLVESYQANLQHWFAPGGLYGFTEGSVSFGLLRSQSLFYRITHNVATSSWIASSWIAYMLFLGCAAVWGILMWRSGERVPSSLAITALVALSFLPFYHSIPDVALLTIALVDAFPSSLRRWTRVQRWVCFLLFLLMLPQRSIFVFLTRHLNASIIRSWWWDLFFTRYMAWLLVALSVALILRMYEAAQQSQEFSSTC